MAKKYRVGIIGFAHMHINNVAALFGSHPQVEWVACADTSPAVPELRVGPYTRAWNIENVRTSLGIPRTYADYHEMLEKEQMDIVIITSENVFHGEIAEACAAKGITVCIEKPMAATLADAQRIARAAEAYGTTVVVNWPLTWSAQARTMKRLIDEGAIGRLLEVKWRAGHTGPLGPGAAHEGVHDAAAPMTGPERGATWWHQTDTGGGAMLDYCCYGAMVSHWYTGQPGLAAMGMKANLASPWGEAEDNGVILVRFPSAMAIFEGSWTQLDYGVSGGPICYGTTGTMLMDAHDERIRLSHGGEHVEWITPDPLPKGRENIAAELIHHLETGEALHPTIELGFNVTAMAILDAGVRSAESGQLELVENDVWCIG